MKLRLLADWLDHRDQQRGGASTEVQDDLRRIAAYVEDMTPATDKEIAKILEVAGDDSLWTDSPEPERKPEPGDGKHHCGMCGGTNTIYSMFSGGKEYYCSDCDDNAAYEPGEAPRRVQMIADGRIAELRAEMDEHLDSLKKRDIDG